MLNARQQSMQKHVSVIVHCISLEQQIGRLLLLAIVKESWKLLGARFGVV